MAGKDHSDGDEIIGIREPVLRIVRREDWMDLPQDEYPGFRVKFWRTFPHSLMTQVQTGTREKQVDALTHIFLEHNGWAGEDGAELPSPGDPAFWDLIPDELQSCLVVLLVQEVQKLPSSLVRNNKT